MPCTSRPAWHVFSLRFSYHNPSGKWVSGDYPLPDLFLEGSTILYDDPGMVVGGSGSPLTTVTSRPLPPRGPICWYWPELGAVCPGLKPDFLGMVVPFIKGVKINCAEILLFQHGLDQNSHLNRPRCASVHGVKGTNERETALPIRRCSEMLSLFDMIGSWFHPTASHWLGYRV